MLKIKLSENTPIGCAFLFVALWIFGIGCWGVNLWKTFNCDWTNQTSWKPEVVHTVGIFVPPVSVVTVWYGTDGK